MKIKKMNRQPSSSRVAALVALCAIGLGALGGCSDFKRWMYEGFGRDDWQQPDRVIAQLGIEQGDRIADLGAGGGYFSLPLARAVGADAYCRDAAVTVDIAKEHIARRHNRRVA